MAHKALILFDDDTASRWLPFTLTRPAGEMRCGAMTQRERLERVLRAKAIGHLCASRLRGFEEPDAPPAIALDDLPSDHDLVLVCSRVVPDWTTAPAIASPSTLFIDGRICGWCLPAGGAAPEAAELADPASAGVRGQRVELAGRWLEAVWDPIRSLPEQLERDLAVLDSGEEAARLPPGVHRIGDGRLVLGRGVVLDPGVVLDLREGPIHLGDDVAVRSFTRIVGPTVVDRGSTVLGGALEKVSIGPMCKVHGEIEESLLLGYSNKAHDGFLGHACVGRWVNLGALTTNSDLKNNYGTIRIDVGDGEVDTGMTKMGCLLGDHVKTAIGTLLNTGTVVGAGSNLFGASLPPKWVPPFTWGASADATPYDLERFIDVARRVMARRGVVLGARGESLLREAWKLARAEPPSR